MPTRDRRAPARPRRGPLPADEIEVDRLARARGFGLDDPCTVLFTSGSTGRPKGIAFTPFNLVSKRFARAAALPAVGRDEVLLCYLPLYHTFGRFLELMGMLYWGGTYAFAGNPSLDALLDGMTKLRPTGLISVPLRWQQIRERTEAGECDLTDVTGGRLRWGLSAAGWLAPDTFRWFHGQGVELCSGFGMTEGTGGLTMTPPGDYREESVGRPLPGVAVRLGPEGELQVAGPYVARYLPADGPPGDLTVENPEDEENWLGTGDLFETLADGHLQIVDRIKDIYKNNRGQTVAPRKVESRFAGVPGIQRTFLAGDGRPYNVLLIVPDLDDPVLQVLTAAEREAYFHRVVTPGQPRPRRPTSAWSNFAVLDRDFSRRPGRADAQGLVPRKTIAANFAELLDQLYRAPHPRPGGRKPCWCPTGCCATWACWRTRSTWTATTWSTSAAGPAYPWPRAAVRAGCGWVTWSTCRPGHERDRPGPVRPPAAAVGGQPHPCRRSCPAATAGTPGSRRFDEQVLLPPRNRPIAIRSAHRAGTIAWASWTTCAGRPCSTRPTPPAWR